MRFVLSLLLCLPAALARADFQSPSAGEVAVRDVPGTGRKWQEARTIVDAPPETVRRWFVDFEYWPGRFHDVKEVRILRRTGATARVWVDSEIMHQLVLDMQVTDDGFYYEADDAHVQANGRVLIKPTPDGRSDVVMQGSANVTGLIGMLAPKSIVRERQLDKLSSDLRDVNRLAAMHRSARRAAPPPRRVLAR